MENILAEFGIQTVKLTLAESETQAADGAMSVDAALKAGLNAFLTDEKGTGVGDSPLAAVMMSPENHGLAAGASASDCSAKLLEYLKTDPKAEIAVLTPSVLSQEKYRFTPEQGETTDENWIFRFMLPTKFDILTWSIVNKAGTKPAYCYSVE